MNRLLNPVVICCAIATVSALAVVSLPIESSIRDLANASTTAQARVADVDFRTNNARPVAPHVPPAAATAGAKMGACCASAPPTCPGDLNGDNTVGISDLLLMLGAWGSCPAGEDCAADLNGDSVVNVSDLLLLLGIWGDCPDAPGAVCLEVDEAECAANGGVFFGTGIGCDNVICEPVPAALEFHQIGFVNDYMDIPLSNWGSLTITYPPADAPLYLNLAIESAPGAPTPSWQIQNMPLLTALTDAPLQTIVYHFDLGNAIGQQVATAEFGATVTASPATAPPITRTTDVGSFIVTLESGKLDEDGIQAMLVFSDPEPLIFPTDPLASGDDGDTAEHTNTDVPNQPALKNECVPTAVSNSLGFLNAKHSLNIPPEEITIAKMRTATGWGPSGTARDWWTNKDAYMQANGFQIETVAEASIADVIAALDANHDVEIDSPNHSAVLVGVTVTKGNDREYAISVAHDIKQDGTAGKAKQVVQQGTYNKNTGAIKGITWIKSLDAFTIEKPLPDDHVKTCKQIATTLSWAQSHLNAVTTLMDELLGPLNDPGADPDDIAAAQDDALNRLGSAIKLIGKAIDHLQSQIDAGGAEDCPSVPAMQQMVTALDNMNNALLQALGALSEAIDNDDLTPEEKKKIYSQVKQATEDASNALMPIIDCLLNPADCPTSIPAGEDCWTTPCNSNSSITLPIPPDFFDPGSDPFKGTIVLGGSKPTQPDTIVRRVDDCVLPNDGDSCTVEIEIIELHLTSCQPITVTYNGGQDPELWDVELNLSKLQAPPPGEMTLTRDSPNGGVFDSISPVVAQIVFTNPNTNEMRVLDPVNETLQTQGAPWSSPNSCSGGCDAFFGPGSLPFKGCGVQVCQNLLDLQSVLCQLPFGCPPCTSGGCPGEGSCCQPNGSPACDDQQCCEAICFSDPFCCDVEWDNLCAKATFGEPACIDACGGDGDR